MTNKKPLPAIELPDISDGDFQSLNIVRIGEEFIVEFIRYFDEVEYQSEHETLRGAINAWNRKVRGI